MDSSSQQLAGWGFAAGALVQGVVLAWWARSRGVGLRRPRVELALGLALGASGLWCLCLAAVLLADATSLLAGAAPLAVARMAAWGAFLVIAATSPPHRWPTGGARWLALGLTVAMMWAGGLQGAALLHGVQPDPRWSGLSLLLASVLVLMLLEQVLRGLSPDLSWSAKPAGLALAAAFGFDFYMYSNAALFGGIDAEVFAMRGWVEVVAALLLWMSLARRSDWLARLRVSQRAAFHSVALLMAGAYLLFVAGVGYYVRLFGGEWGPALQQGMVFLAVLVLVGLALSGAVRARLRVFLSKNFFRYRYDYRDEWLKFTHALSSQGTPSELGMQVIRGLADLVESPGGGLWVKPTGQAHYVQTARWNMPAVGELEPEAGALVQSLDGLGKVVSVAEWQRHPDRYLNAPLPLWLAGLEDAWLLVPLRASNDMLGFVLLVTPRARFDLNWEVYDLLKTAGRQAAGFLGQMMATEALLEARKFDAFNRMSAFVVHDLKNIITQLSLMMKNAKRLQANPEFQQDMLMTVENSLEKMRQMMAQLRQGAEAPEAGVGVDLRALASRLQDSAARQGRELSVRCEQPWLARGSAARLERVVGHWVQNALDATDAGQALWLHVDRVSGFMQVVVGDAGPGMSREFVRDELFRPFRSTKGTGMGLGAYESQQYVQELGGKITVDSEPGQGTRVTMLLPLFERPAAPDLDILKPAAPGPTAVQPAGDALP